MFLCRDRVSSVFVGGGRRGSDLRGQSEGSATGAAAGYVAVDAAIRPCHVGEAILENYTEVKAVYLNMGMAVPQ